VLIRQTRRARFGYWEIVNAANEALAPNTKAVPFAWKLCSGIAHGDLWTTISAAEKVELPDAPPGMASFQLSANLKNLMYVTTFATHDHARLASVRRAIPQTLLSHLAVPQLNSTRHDRMLGCRPWTASLFSPVGVDEGRSSVTGEFAARRC